MAILIWTDKTGVIEDSTVNSSQSNSTIYIVDNPILSTYRTFTALNDTPDNYSGSDNKIPIVNEQKNNLEFKTIGEIGDSRFVQHSEVINNVNNTSDNKPLSANMGKHLEESKVNYSDVKNVLNDTSTNKPLSAAMGKQLKDEKLNISDVKNDVTSTDIDKPLSANMGKHLNQSKVNYSDVKNVLNDSSTNKPLSAAMGKQLKESVDNRYTKAESDIKYARKHNASDIGTGTANSNKILHGDMVWRDQTALSAEVLTGTIANRPVAAIANKGDFYVVSKDTVSNNGKMFISDGIEWILVEHPAASYSKADSDSRYLGINDKAQDSEALDGLNSSDFLRNNAKSVDSAKLEGRSKAQVIAEARSGYQTTTAADAKYLGKSSKSVDSAKLEGRSKAQVVAEARSGLILESTSNARYLKLTGGTIATKVKIQTGGTIGGGNVSDAPLIIDGSMGIDGNEIYSTQDIIVGTTANNIIFKKGSTQVAKIDATGIYEGNAKLSDKYLGKSSKSVDSAKLEGRSKAQVIAEARSGLATTSYAYSKSQSNSLYLGKRSKAADSTLLNGINQSTTATANKIVQRDSAADIHCRLLRPNYANQADISGALAFRINNSSDNYLRFCSSTSAIRAWLATYSKTESNARYLGKTAKAADADKLDGYDISQIMRRIDNTADYKSSANIMCMQTCSNRRPVGLSGAYPYGGLLTLNTASNRLRIYAPHNEGNKSAMYFNTGYGNDQKPWQRVMTYSDGDGRYLGKTSRASSATYAVRVTENSTNSIDLIDHSDHTWFRNSANTWTFQGGGAGDDWTQTFSFALDAVGSGYNDKWMRVGQRQSNATHGRYRGLRIEKYYNKRVVGGDLSLGNIYVDAEVAANRVECGYNHNQSNSVGCSNWFRSSGKTGWINSSYGGGIYMTDTTYIRTYGGKKFYVDNTDARYAIHTAGGINTNKQFNVGGRKLITGSAGSGAPSAASVAVGGLYVRW
ncbi:hypothetical protein VME_45710 [Vibrio harveyi 1DA3]|nr:hypothetical protein VME_45710 [Vibrio harveyi 1DA3]